MPTDFYPLEALLRIRERRERQALQEVARQRSILKLKETALHDFETQRDAYHQWREEREEREWAHQIGHSSPLSDIEEFRADLAEWRQREVQFDDRIVDARRERDEEQLRLDESLKRYHNVSRGLEKLREHRRRWQRVAQFEIEHRQDLEMEDFTYHRVEALHNRRKDPRS